MLQLSEVETTYTELVRAKAIKENASVQEVLKKKNVI